MEPVQMKFAAFMSALSPEEQRAVVPLMATFVGTMGAPGGAGPAPDAAPPLPPPGTEPAMKPPLPVSAAGGSAIPGGPPLPPPDPVAMSIGRQQY